MRAFDPDAPGDALEAFIPKDVLQWYYGHHPVTWRNVEVALEVLERPARVFCGIREHQPGGWCYSGRPERYWIRVGITVPLPKALVFAVYMNPSHHVYLWRLERADPDDAYAPDGWEERYGGVAWKRGS